MNKKLAINFGILLYNISVFGVIIYNWLYCTDPKISNYLNNYVIAFTIIETLMLIASGLSFILIDNVPNQKKIIDEYNLMYNKYLYGTHFVLFSLMLPIIAINGYFFLLVVVIFNNLLLPYKFRQKILHLDKKLKDPEHIT